jgi:hypothetical protein
MERELWQRCIVIVKRQARKLGRLPKATYRDWLIVAMSLWHTAHDRPMCWACAPENYRPWFRPRRLPSISQFTRRVAGRRCQQILQAVHAETARLGWPATVSYLDGKPLTVGVASKDWEAKRGHVMGGFAKGYKVHVWATEDRRIPVFSVQSLNRHESPVAEAMLAQVPVLSDQAVILADSNYDATRLYGAAAARNGALVVKPRGIAKHPKTLEQSGPYRREAIAQWGEARQPVVRMVYKDRIKVEGILSSLTCYGGGLGPLPAWVRTLKRVTRWVGIKIILYHVRLTLRTTTESSP